MQHAVDSLITYPDSVNISGSDTLNVEITNGLHFDNSTTELINTLLTNEPNWISIIAIIALIISVLTMIANIVYHNASLKPLLIFRSENHRKYNRVRFYMANKGLGPLKIKSFKYLYGGVAYAKMYDLFHHIRKLKKIDNSEFAENSRSYVKVLDEYALTPNEEKLFLSMSF